MDIEALRIYSFCFSPLVFGRCEMLGNVQ
jgi:hypothetical protein